MPSQYQIEGSTSAAIAASIEDGISSGALVHGQLLPPIRQLAGDLSVSAGTVAAAYRLVGQRGLTSSDRRRGTRVRSWQSEPRPLASFPGSLAAAPAAVDLASGNPDRTLLPDLRPLLSELRDYEGGQYGDAPLLARLGEVTRTGLEAERVRAAAITPAFGALDGIQRLLATSLRPGDRVAVEDPGWPSLLHGVRRSGYVPVPVEVDDDGPVPDALWGALAAGARAVVVTCRAQNPTGAALSAARAAELAAIWQRYPGVLLVEDDHGYGVAEPGSRLHSIAAASDPAGPWAIVRSASKAYGPDLRLAVVAGDLTTVARVEAHIAAGAGWVSHLLQHLVAALWSDPGVAAGVERAAAAYEERRRALVDALDSEGLPARGRTGLNVWVPLEGDGAADEAACVAELLEGGWKVAAGAAWRLVSGPAIRITTASLSPSDAPKVAGAVARAVRHRPTGGY